MPYSDFSLNDLEVKFGVHNLRKHLFSELPLFEPSQRLKTELSEAEEMSLKSEKAKSEWIVVPILRELRNRNDKFFTVYSGENLNADPEHGLNGECDFILSKETWSFEVSFPIVQIVEAKKNDIEEGIRQCAAQMVGARVFNQRKGIELEKIYGCSTTGDAWQFMELSDNLYIDIHRYYLGELEELLGVFQHIITHFRQTIPADLNKRN